MRIGQLADLIVTSYNDPAMRRRTLFFIGASGVGKSASVYQAAEKLNIPVVDLRLSDREPCDLRGLPSVVNDRTVWNVPAFFPTEDEPCGILFVDEITSAPPAMQAVAYQIALEHRIGDKTLPEGWMVIAAGNRANDRGVTFQMAAPLLNRMIQVEVDTVLDDWIEYAAQSGVRPEVMAFVSDRPDLLHKFTKDDYGKQFPSPRSWFAASDVLNLNLPANLRVEMLVGAIGHEAALSFEQFMRVWETMPSLERIENDPDAVPVPDELNVRYCVAMGLSARLNKQNFGNVYRYLARMSREFQTLVVKLAYQRDRTIAQAPAFVSWARENASAFSRV